MVRFSLVEEDSQGCETYSFLNLAEIFELLTQSVLISVPGEATNYKSAKIKVWDKISGATYPMKSLDILRDVLWKQGSG